MVPSFAWNRERDAAIAAGLEKSRVGSNADISLALFTNVLENASDLYGAGDAAFLHDLFGADLPARLPALCREKRISFPGLGRNSGNRAGRKGTLSPFYPSPSLPKTISCTRTKPVIFICHGRRCVKYKRCLPSRFFLPLLTPAV